MEQGWNNESRSPAEEEDEPRATVDAASTDATRVHEPFILLLLLLLLFLCAQWHCYKQTLGAPTLKMGETRRTSSPDLDHLLFSFVSDSVSVRQSKREESNCCFLFLCFFGFKGVVWYVVSVWFYFYTKGGGQGSDSITPHLTGFNFLFSSGLI